MENEITTFAQRLKECLETKHVSAAELARNTGISKSLISHYMSGHAKPKADKLLLISEKLNVNPIWLMGYSAPMEHSLVNIEIQSIISLLLDNNVDVEDLKKVEVFIREIILR